MNGNLDQLRQRWQDAYNRDDLAAVAQLYAHNAAFYDYRGCITKGRSAIQTELGVIRDDLRERAPGGRLRFESRVLEQQIYGNNGQLIAAYQYLAPDGAVVLEGYCTVLLRQEGDDWRIATHMTTAHLTTPVAKRGLVIA
jgi:ketosteroid isomerase-like protein